MAQWPPKRRPPCPPVAMPLLYMLFWFSPRSTGEWRFHGQLQGGRDRGAMAPPPKAWWKWKKCPNLEHFALCKKKIPRGHAPRPPSFPPYFWCSSPLAPSNANFWSHLCPWALHCGFPELYSVEGTPRISSAARGHVTIKYIPLNHTNIA